SLLLRPRQTASQWFDDVASKVTLALFTLIVLAIPSFFLILQNKYLLLYYIAYPTTMGLALYLRTLKKECLSSIVTIIGVYGVVVWLAVLVDIKSISYLVWWIISLLPWVLFTEKQRVWLLLTAALPILFSFLSTSIPLPQSPILPAEQDFLRQMLHISVALGAFSCIYFLKSALNQSEKQRTLENELYNLCFNSIPLPVIIKDAITLEYIYFNTAAQMTFGLSQDRLYSNAILFSESCATHISLLDRDTLKTMAYHIESEERLEYINSEIYWRFRTYRIPLLLQESRRRILLTVYELRD
ncbi:MAG TPA: hypothetical protein PLY93_04460, partial [Turneriella sp.]|nr:hypothetical protein [Turneriella sp.]